MYLQKYIENAVIQKKNFNLHIKMKKKIFFNKKIN